MRPSLHEADATPIAPPRLGVRTTTPVPRQRFVRIRRALTRRGDGVLVW